LPTSAGPAVQRYLGQIDAQGRSDRTNYDKIIANLGEIAKSKRNSQAVRAASELLDRAFGKAPQSINSNITFTREEDLNFLLEALGLKHGDGSTTVQ